MPHHRTQSKLKAQRSTRIFSRLQARLCAHISKATARVSCWRDSQIRIATAASAPDVSSAPRLVHRAHTSLTVRCARGCLPRSQDTWRAPGLLKCSALCETRPTMRELNEDPKRFQRRGNTGMDAHACRRRALPPRSHRGDRPAPHTSRCQPVYSTSLQAPETTSADKNGSAFQQSIGVVAIDDAVAIRRRLISS